MCGYSPRIAQKTTGLGHGGYELHTGHSTDEWPLANPILTEPIDPNTTILSSTNSLLAPKGKRSLGCVTPDGVTPTTPGLQQLMTLTFTPQVPLPNPAHLQIVGVGSFAYGDWADPDFNDYWMPITSITLTPDPATLSLLALVGVGLIAKRRRQFG